MPYPVSGSQVAVAYYELVGPTGSAWKVIFNGVVPSKLELTGASKASHVTVAALPQEAAYDMDPDSGRVLIPAEYSRIVEMFRADAYAVPDISLDTQPINGPSTKATGTYDPSTSQLLTKYDIITAIPASEAAIQGNTNSTLMALYAYQWKNLAANSTGGLLPYTYNSPVGPMRLLMPTTKALSASDNINEFQTQLSYTGVLPTVPQQITDPALLQKLQQELQTVVTSAIDGAYGLSNLFNNGGSNQGTYNGAKFMARLANLIPIADAVDQTTGTTHFRDQLLYQLKRQLAAWFDVTDSQYLFYNTDWKTMFGFPEEFDMASSLQDHHFMWGYFVNAAAMVGVYDPSFVSSSQYGQIINLLIRDVANWDRTDADPNQNPADPYRFAYENYFDDYAGHPWTGTASLGDGFNQEASSEGMNLSSGMILYGQVLMAQGDPLGKTIRDAGIYRYATEVAAVGQTYFNVDEDNFYKQSPVNTSNGSVLSSAIDNQNATTSLVLADDPVTVRQVFADPAKTGPYEILVDRELMLATGFNASTRTLTVIRGIENTPRAAHKAGAAVLLVTATLQAQPPQVATLGGTGFNDSSGTNPNIPVTVSSKVTTPTTPFFVLMNGTLEQVQSTGPAGASPWTFIYTAGPQQAHAASEPIFLTSGKAGLATAISDSDTKLTLNNGFNQSLQGFPANAPFLIQIDSEVMQVTSIIPPTMTDPTTKFVVTRGVLGTTKAAHVQMGSSTCCRLHPSRSRFARHSQPISPRVVRPLGSPVSWDFLPTVAI